MRINLSKIGSQFMSKDLKTFMNQKPITLMTESRWYLATPYSHKDSEVMAAREAEAKRIEAFINENYLYVRAYSPIADTAELEKNGDVPDEGWFLRDFKKLARMDTLCVVMMDGWQSSIGVALEIAYALGKGMNIFYATPEELLSKKYIF